MHQAAVADFARTDDRIETVLDHVDEAIVVVEVEFDLQKSRDEFAEQRREQVGGERNADAKPPPGRRRRLRQLRFGRFQFGQYPVTAIEEYLAFLGQRDGPGRSM